MKMTDFFKVLRESGYMRIEGARWQIEGPEEQLLAKAQTIDFRGALTSLIRQLNYYRFSRSLEVRSDERGLGRNLKFIHSVELPLDVLSNPDSALCFIQKSDFLTIYKGDGASAPSSVQVRNTRAKPLHKALKTEAGSAERKISQLRTKITSLFDTINTLNTDAESAKCEIAELRAENAWLIQTNHTLQGEVALLRALLHTDPATTLSLPTPAALSLLEANGLGDIGSSAFAPTDSQSILDGLTPLATDAEEAKAADAATAANASDDIDFGTFSPTFSQSILDGLTPPATDAEEAMASDAATAANASVDIDFGTFSPTFSQSILNGLTPIATDAEEAVPPNTTGATPLAKGTDRAALSFFHTDPTELQSTTESDPSKKRRIGL